MSQALREALARAIEGLGGRKALSFADFIEKGEDYVPCWGGIFERFVESFSQDEQLKLWRVFVEAADPRPLGLFIWLHRDRREVLEIILEDAKRLPMVLQRALASLRVLSNLSDEQREMLSPEAQQIYEADDRTRARERQRFELRNNKLMHLRFIVPEPDDDDE